MKKQWKYGLGAFVVVVVAACLVLISKPPTAPALPVPNGYDEFVKATQQVTTEGRAYRDVSDDELRNVAKQNREVLESVRAACQHECRAPIVYNRSYFSTHTQILAGFKRLARAFWAEAVLAERESRTNDAARSYVNGIRFAQEIGRGGRLVDRLQAASCQALLMPSLTNLAQNLDAQTCRALAGVLESLDKRTESWEATVRRERMWMQVVGGPRGRLLVFLHEVETWWSTGIWPSKQFRNNSNRIQSQERHLILDLARRAYQLEHGEAPRRPGDLVPVFLQAIPKDPVTGKDMALQ
jgi:hypothetical protein